VALNTGGGERIRLILQDTLCQRIKQNPRYSMRAFARSLGMSHTVMSLVLSGKRPLSKKAASKVAEALPISKSERQPFLDWAASKASQEELAELRMQQISLDTFSLLSDWYHYAILSLLEVSHVSFEEISISKRLGITKIQAKDAMERLKRLGLVEKKGGRWRQCGGPLMVENTISTAATRRFHKTLLLKAIESLENDPMELRDFSSTTLAMDPADVGFALQKIRRFRRSLSRELEGRGKPKAVYNLMVQLFPLSRGHL